MPTRKLYTPCGFHWSDHNGTMNIRYSTHIPNILFDKLLPRLTLAELKLLLIIYRQTNGWIDRETGKRKTRDWITHQQFMTRTGLTRQTISSTLDTLVQQGLISITGLGYKELNTGTERRGKTKLFYAVNPLEDVRLFNTTCKVSGIGDVRSAVYNKTNYTKEKKTKGFRSIGSILKRWYRWNKDPNNHERDG